MRITEGCLSHGNSFLLAQCLSKSLGTQFEKCLAATRRCRNTEVNARKLGLGICTCWTGPIGLVDSNVSNPVEDLGSAVLGLTTGEQVRTLIDEAGGEVSGLELVVIEDTL